MDHVAAAQVGGDGHTAQHVLPPVPDAGPTNVVTRLSSFGYKIDHRRTLPRPLADPKPPTRMMVADGAGLIDVKKAWPVVIGRTDV
jgi:hypothetical protein